MKNCFVYRINNNFEQPVLLGEFCKENNYYTFKFDNNYLFENAVSPLFDLKPNYSKQSYPFESFVPYAIRDASPDAWGRNLILYRLGKEYNDLTEIDFLLNSNQDRIGNLFFSEKRNLSIEEVRDEQQNFSFEELQEAFEIIKSNDLANSRKINPQIESVLKHGTSVGGARPKALMEYKGKKYLAKFNTSTDIYDVISAEFLALKLAKKCGINTVDCELKTLNSKKFNQYNNLKKVLLIERFDREKANNSLYWKRKNIVSALSVLKLDDFSARFASYEIFFNKLRQLSHQNRQKELGKEIFKRIVFNILTGNNDDHARNHACFYENGQLLLTPCYDICPSPRSGTESNQAMFIGNGDRRSLLVTCLNNAKQYLLEYSEAKEIISDMIQTVRIEIGNIFEKYDLPQKLFDSLYKSAIFNDYAFYYGCEDLKPEQIKLKKKNAFIFKR